MALLGVAVRCAATSAKLAMRACCGFYNAVDRSLAVQGVVGGKRGDIIEQVDAHEESMAVKQGVIVR